MNRLRTVIAICLLALAAPALAQSAAGAKSPATPEAAQAALTRARNLLKGADKQTDAAKAILADLLKNSASKLSITEGCYLYVYLGYIEDLAGNRRAAIEWFRKGAALEGPDVNIKFIRALARQGLKKPVTWIRHLDEDSKSAGPVGKKTPADSRGDDVVERIGKGLVLRSQPQKRSPKSVLSKAARIENFNILAEAIDKYYSFFTHKRIDWDDIVERYRPWVENAETADDFYSLMYDLVRELGDCHSWLCNYYDAPSLGRYRPPMATRRIEGKLVVTTVDENAEPWQRGLRPGSVIEHLDGLSVEDKIEVIRPLMRVYSSQRAFLEEAYRKILCGKQGTSVAVSFVTSAGGPAQTVTLRRIVAERRNPFIVPFSVRKGDFIWYGIHPSGRGYIRILSFSGRGEIADEFDFALEKLKNTPALIIDVRENSGGYGIAQAAIIGRLVSARTMIDTGYMKSGPGHEDFTKRDSYVEPAGKWQYTRPIALLTNAVTGSAADLFVCRLTSTGRPITVGSTTHGNLTGTCVFVQLPCNLVVRVSSGYVCDASGRIIETNGNEVLIAAELTIDDIVNGTDSVIERAVEELARTSSP